ncbi:hypothetical protein MHUMG1_06491 [Metarhizium humberi]|uniref:Uncharacterized protein n=1 Tax=Metarhizium humberi TaxID=2596975 RepID=A0A9P8M9A0_9HYPO|nr:hypothetical protein MHUMG1_06491 [Metarhizium humberi]
MHKTSYHTLALPFLGFSVLAVGGRVGVTMVITKASKDARTPILYPPACSLNTMARVLRRVTRETTNGQAASAHRLPPKSKASGTANKGYHTRLSNHFMERLNSSQCPPLSWSQILPIFPKELPRPRSPRHIKLQQWRQSQNALTPC